MGLIVGHPRKIIMVTYCFSPQPLSLTPTDNFSLPIQYTFHSGFVPTHIKCVPLSEQFSFLLWFIVNNNNRHLTSATYGYDSSESRPLLSRMYWKALSINPPLQPWLPSAVEQSTRFCSLRDTSFPVFLNCWPSKAPVALKAQHEPQCPWNEKGWAICSFRH